MGYSGGGGGGAATFSGCKVRKTATQAINNVTAGQVVVFGTGNGSEDFDTDAYHDLTTNPGRLTAAVAGKYLVTGSLSWAVNVAGYRALKIWKSSDANKPQLSSYIQANTIAGNRTSHSASGIIELSAGEYVFMEADQSSGGALNLELGVTSGQVADTFLELVKVG